jgi:hypothetical protein
VGPDELADGCQRAVGVPQRPREQLEDVPAAREHLQQGIDVRGGQRRVQPARVGEQQLVAADLDERGRQPVQIGRDQRGQRVPCRMMTVSRPPSSTTYQLT